MKENLVNISFIARGAIVQDIVLSTDDPIDADELVRMLTCGEAFTTVHEDNDVIMSDGSVIGTVRYSDTELEYTDFQVEGGNYDQTPSKPFDMSRLAWAGAMEEFVYEPEMSLEEITEVLEASMDSVPNLNLEEGSMNYTGKRLLTEISMLSGGLKNLMTTAYNAGKNGQEIK